MTRMARFLISSAAFCLDERVPAGKIDECLIFSDRVVRSEERPLKFIVGAHTILLQVVSKTL